MKVKLLAITPNPINTMYIAARTCYSSEGPISMFEKEYDIEKMKKLVKTVLDSGHQSIAEHINLTFGIEEVSRSLTHQLVRHRHCTFSQQSQRYVDMEECQFVKPDVMNQKAFDSMCETIRLEYKALRSCDMAKEDARAILPNCTATNIVMTCNLRQLMHICNLRLCTRAQKEIRDLFKEIKKEVTKENEFLGSFLVPSCEINGFCTEAKCCGRKPSIKEVMDIYKNKDKE